MSVAGVALTVLALLQGLILACLGYQVILAVASAWPSRRASPKSGRDAVPPRTRAVSPSRSTFVARDERRQAAASGLNEDAVAIAETRGGAPADRPDPTCAKMMVESWAMRLAQGGWAS